MNKLLMALCLTFSLNSNSMDLKTLEQEIITDYEESLNIRDIPHFRSLNVRTISHSRSIKNISLRHPLLKRRLRKSVSKTLENLFTYNINPLDSDDEGIVDM